MTEVVGTYSFDSYDFLVEKPIIIDDMILSLEPLDYPLLTGVGGSGVPVLGRQPVADRVFNWQEQEAPLPRGRTNEALDSSETGIDVVAGDAVKFAVGDTILIDNEYMKVTAIDTSTDVLTVTRGTLGSTAASHSTNAEIIGIGTVLAEGSIGEATFKGRDLLTNYTQIWSGRVKVTRTERNVSKYGIPSEFTHQLMRRTNHLMLGVEQAAVYGKKYQDTATSTRSTGGLNGFITSHIDSTADWITHDTIHDQLQDIYDDGGVATHLMAKPKNFGALTNAEGSERVQTQSIDDTRRGRRSVQVVMTEFGDVTCVRNRWCRDSDAFLYKPERFVMCVFQPLMVQPLAKTGDTDEVMMVMEAGFKVKGEQHMAKFTGLDATAAMPSNLI